MTFGEGEVVSIVLKPIGPPEWMNLKEIGVLLLVLDVTRVLSGLIVNWQSLIFSVNSNYTVQPILFEGNLYLYPKRSTVVRRILSRTLQL